MRTLMATAALMLVLALAVCALMASAAHANPCADTVDLPDGRASVSRACAVNAATMRKVTIPALEVSLRTCTAKRGADAGLASARLAACDAQVKAQAAMLDDAARPVVVPWYGSRWLAFGVGVVSGGAAVYFLRR
jgi:hypothetical protein